MADLVITPANVQAGPRALKEQGIAGATITAGQTVYLDTSDMRMKLADANGSVAQAAVVGVALNGASNGQPITVVYDDDDFSPGATVTNGTFYVQSGNPGGIAPVADIVTGWRPALVMIGKPGNKAVLKIVRTGVAV